MNKIKIYCLAFREEASGRNTMTGDWHTSREYVRAELKETAEAIKNESREDNGVKVLSESDDMFYYEVSGRKGTFYIEDSALQFDKGTKIKGGKL